MTGSTNSHQDDEHVEVDLDNHHRQVSIPSNTIEDGTAPKNDGDDGDVSPLPKPKRISMSTTTKVTAASAPDDLSYHPGMLRLFAPPRQRQTWNDTQILPRLNWGDLFFDLFYVAAAYNTSNILVDSPTQTGFLYFSGTFLSVMQMWWDKTVFDARYVIGDDLYHRIFEVVWLLVLACAVVHIRTVDILSNPSEYGAIIAFAVSVGTSDVLSIIRYCEVYFFGIGQRDVLKPSVRKDVVPFFMSLLFYIGAAVAAAIVAKDASVEKKESDLYYTVTDQDGHRVIAEAYDSTKAETANSTTTNIPIFLVLFAVVSRHLIVFARVILLFPNDGSHKKYMVPMNIDFTIHRNSEWTMLMLGESILSLLIVDVPEEGRDYHITFYCSLTTVILLQYLHFRSQPHHADDHASRRNKDAGLLWHYFTFLYSMALVALGAAYSLFVLEFSYLDYEKTYETTSSGYGYDDAAEGYGSTTGSTYGTEETGGHRFLAGGGAPKYGTEERQQRLAHVFSISFAMVLFCLDAMSFCHLGFKKSVKKCQCNVHPIMMAIKSIEIISLRIALIAFVATLSQWNTNPAQLSGIGLGVVLIQIVIRFVGAVIFKKYSSVGMAESH